MADKRSAKEILAALQEDAARRKEEAHTRQYGKANATLTFTTKDREREAEIVSDLIDARISVAPSEDREPWTEEETRRVDAQLTTIITHYLTDLGYPPLSPMVRGPITLTDPTTQGDTP